MEKILKVNGIDCANCATKIEGKISKIKGVEDASVNFMTGKVIIDFGKEINDESKVKILDEVKKVINKIEPDASIEE